MATTITTRDGHVYEPISDWLDLKINEDDRIYFEYENEKVYMDEFHMTYPSFYDDENGKLGWIGYFHEHKNLAVEWNDYDQVRYYREIH